MHRLILGLQGHLMTKDFQSNTVDGNIIDGCENRLKYRGAFRYNPTSIQTEECKWPIDYCIQERVYITPQTNGPFPGKMAITALDLKKNLGYRFFWANMDLMPLRTRRQVDGQLQALAKIRPERKLLLLW